MKITQNARFLSDLVREAKQGVILPAAFQRPYAWGKKEVLDLCESIASGYPLGAFFLWSIPQKDALAKTKSRLGPIAMRNTDDQFPSQIGVLLDGQNRLATMAWLLLDQSESNQESISAALTGQERLVWGTESSVIAYDLIEKRFEFTSKAGLLVGFKVPSWILMDATRINKYLRDKFRGEWSAVEEAQQDQINEALNAANRQFMEARVITTVLSEATAIQAKDAFLKVCRVGVPMSEEDFEAATMWSE